MHPHARSISHARPALLGVLLVCGMGLIGPVGAAMGQTGIPEQVITGGPVSPDGLAAIKQLIADNTAGLASDDPALVRRARQTLTAPLREPAATTDFRTAFAAEIVETLRLMARGERENAAINALVVAGELGTREGVDILTAALEDKRPAIRARAALGLKRTFTICADARTPALLARQVDAAVAALERASASESDGLVLDAIAAGLEGAAGIPEAKLEGVREKAVLALIRVVNSGAARLGAAAGAGAEAGAVLELRGTRALFDILQNTAVQLNNASLVEAAGMGGEALARVACRLKAGEVAPEDRQRLALIATQAERVVVFASSRLGQQRNEVRIGDAVARADDARVQAEVTRLAGDAGDLTKAPFSLPAARFACK